ncbi:TM2 domain-containing protein [Pedobacter changchengzhani]|uniref:TM2 domain-containing protein n=1 Tax=Pedobacter changchengzhani TaxID=2529274 RepID=A0A4R5MNQ8_9SPHI|nr:TM2 domain-containing protein [Pedobacter changchengzhani]TDG37404.1 TM2 domain-containing protein [Pedobacter changchengzhani]
MDNYQSPLMALPGITPEEFSYLQQATTGLNEQQMRNFLMFYSGRRKNPSDMLIFCLIGLLVLPGLQRFIIGQIGMGILYLLTWGLCFIGSIVDIVNHKDLAFQHNQKMAFESLQMVRMGGFQQPAPTTPVDNKF